VFTCKGIAMKDAKTATIARAGGRERRSAAARRRAEPPADVDVAEARRKAERRARLLAGLLDAGKPSDLDT
jgi:hypothetical protein